MKTPHILIIRFSAIGDVAMLVPVVSSLAKQYPNVRITVLSRPFARPFFENLADNVGFMGADLKDEYKGLSGLNALYRRLQAKHFTHVADMHGVLRSHYLRLRFMLSNYKVEHIDKHRKEKRALINEDKANFHQLSTSFRNYADVLERLGYFITPDFKSIFGEGRGNLRLLPPEIGEKKSFTKWIGIAPFAAHKGKIYPLEKMEQVMQMIIKAHPNCRIFLFHGRGEEAQKMKEWQDKYPQVTSASSTLKNMNEELILMSHLNAMISMDSGNMHLASLVACPVISIWGATHRYAGFLGWNQSVDNVVELDLKCRPCSIYGNIPCQYGNYKCLNEITPENVFNHVEKIIV